jgi:hypothetical protein
MTSAKKIAANRANAKKSSGPRTEAGKQRASRNALRHGLSALRYKDYAIDAEVEQMAKNICGDDTNLLLFEQALVIAESALWLRSVHKQKIAIIERLYDPWLCSLSKGDLRIPMAELRSRQGQIAYAGYSRLYHKLHKQGEEIWAFIQPGEVKPNEPIARYEPLVERDEHEAIEEALPDLARLLRYERRALSRRKRALFEFVAIKLTDPTPTGV